MILDQTDPTGLGLFSRCARNQACQSTKTRPQTASSKKSPIEPSSITESKRKNTLNISNDTWFARQQSREQRQKKFKKEHTPAVGQYNVSSQGRDKPKLVWDVIKLYQKRSKETKKLQELREKIRKSNHNNNDKMYKSVSHDLDTHQHSNSNININTNRQSSSNHNVSGTIITQPYTSSQKYHTQTLQRHFSQQQQPKQKLHTLPTNPLQSISPHTPAVNMHRTTGRYNTFSLNRKSPSINQNQTLLTLQQSSPSHDNIQLNKSLQKIKPRTKPNYYFKKMLGRKDHDTTIGTANIYDCNINAIKPRRTALLSFALLKGREDGAGKDRGIRGDVHSYTYYDFNEYVWKSTSAVFPNTKKGLVSFQKQK